MIRYKLDEIKDCADISVVAESIGLQMKRRGARYSILCPNPEHNDKHFGNCVLTPKGFKCYSCGAYGDVFDLVRLALNVSKQEAYGIVADICGGRDNFIIKQSNQEKSKKPFVKLPDRELLEFIGLHQGSADRYSPMSVYMCKRILDPLEPYEPNPGESVRFEPGKTPEEDCKVIYQRISSNPLQELANEEPAIFRELIYNKAKETMEKYADMIRCVQTQDNTHEFGYYCNVVAQTSGMDAFITACEQNIDKARKIAEKFSDKEKTKNIFGKLQLGAVL